MGYTCGRKHTEESLTEIAKLYNTRSDFQKNDPGAYGSAKRRGKLFLDYICSHMVSSYSTPQLICKKIMEELLGEKCLYNTRAIIKPYELDIYFPEFKLAIEYNGKGWHKYDDVIKRDNNKNILCNKNGITLIIIKENNRDYEKDVKIQLIDHLDIINKITNNNFIESDIYQISCFDVFEDIIKKNDIDEIKNKIKNCSSIIEFQKKYSFEYNFLRRNKKLQLLECIRKTKEDSEEELLEKCKKISDYSEFIKIHHNLYQKCKIRNLLEKATSHMHKTNKKYRSHSNDDLIKLANKFQLKSYLKNQNKALYLELIKRDILNLVTYEPNFIYKHTNKILKEKKLEKCFEDAKKYDNYHDFKNDEDLYNRCVKYKIIKKITETFTKNNINDIILKESKKYKNFNEFTKSIWYMKTKHIKGLIQKIKKENNWSLTKKGKLNYIEKFPNIVKMINNNVELNDIFKITKINKTTLWRIKVQMHKSGILKVGYNQKKDK